MNAATRTALTTTGTAVQVQVTDFSKAGFAAGLPSIWVTGTVTAVGTIGKPEAGLSDVTISTELGTVESRIVGKRGGGAQTLRLA